jgi:hypothetical protein
MSWWTSRAPFLDGGAETGLPEGGGKVGRLVLPVGPPGSLPGQFGGCVLADITSGSKWPWAENGSVSTSSAMRLVLMRKRVSLRNAKSGQTRRDPGFFNLFMP